MSRHNRGRRAPGVRKARSHAEPPGENRRASERHRDNFAFYRAIRMAQDRANRDQMFDAVRGFGGQYATIHPYPQRYAGERV